MNGAVSLSSKPRKALNLIASGSYVYEKFGNEYVVNSKNGKKAPFGGTKVSFDVFIKQVREAINNINGNGEIDDSRALSNKVTIAAKKHDKNIDSRYGKLIGAIIRLAERVLNLFRIRSFQTGAEELTAMLLNKEVPMSTPIPLTSQEQKEWTPLENILIKKQCKEGDLELVKQALHQIEPPVRRAIYRIFPKVIADENNTDKIKEKLLALGSLDFIVRRILQRLEEESEEGLAKDTYFDILIGQLKIDLGVEVFWAGTITAFQEKILPIIQNRHAEQQQHNIQELGEHYRLGDDAWLLKEGNIRDLAKRIACPVEELIGISLDKRAFQLKLALLGDSEVVVEKDQWDQDYLEKLARRYRLEDGDIELLKEENIGHLEELFGCKAGELKRICLEDRAQQLKLVRESQESFKNLEIRKRKAFSEAKSCFDQQFPHLKRIETDARGDCFFDAIAKQLNSTVEELRNMIADFLENSDNEDLLLRMYVTGCDADAPNLTGKGLIKRDAKNVRVLASEIHDESRDMSRAYWPYFRILAHLLKHRIVLFVKDENEKKIGRFYYNTDLNDNNLPINGQPIRLFHYGCFYKRRQYGHYEGAERR